MKPQLSLVKFREKESYTPSVLSLILPIQSKEVLKRRRKLKWQNTAFELLLLKELGAPSVRWETSIIPEDEILT